MLDLHQHSDSGEWHLDDRDFMYSIQADIDHRADDGQMTVILSSDVEEGTRLPGLEISIYGWPSGRYDEYLDGEKIQSGRAFSTTMSCTLVGGSVTRLELWQDAPTPLPPVVEMIPNADSVEKIRQEISDIREALLLLEQRIERR